MRFTYIADGGGASTFGDDLMVFDLRSCFLFPGDELYRGEHLHLTKRCQEGDEVFCSTSTTFSIIGLTLLVISKLIYHG